MDMSNTGNDSGKSQLNYWVFVFCVAVSVFLLWFSTFQTCHTYYDTPYVANFSRFVNPTVEKTVSKAGYLFSPLLIFLLGICTIFISERFLNARYPKLKFLNRRLVRAVLLVLWSFLFFAMLGVDHGRALGAASRYPQRWLINQPSWVDPVCSVVRFGSF